MKTQSIKALVFLGLHVITLLALANLYLMSQVKIEKDVRSEYHTKYIVLIKSRDTIQKQFDEIDRKGGHADIIFPDRIIALHKTLVIKFSNSILENFNIECYNIDPCIKVDNADAGGSVLFDGGVLINAGIYFKK